MLFRSEAGFACGVAEERQEDREAAGREDARNDDVDGAERQWRSQTTKPVGSDMYLCSVYTRFFIFFKGMYICIMRFG